AEGPSNFQSRANFTSDCAQTGLTVSAAAAAPTSIPKSLVLFMFDAPCEAGRPARYALPQQSPCQPEACAERRQHSALAARLEPISKAFEEDHETCKLDKAEKIVGVVLPANEDPALPLNPGEEALTEPASHVAA